MKIKFDKERIGYGCEAQVKNDVADFKEMYTEGDLLRAFRESNDWYENCCSDILKTDIHAMTSGWASGDKTVFWIEMILNDYTAMHKIRFGVDMNLTVTTYQITKYALVEGE